MSSQIFCRSKISYARSRESQAADRLISSGDALMAIFTALPFRQLRDELAPLVTWPQLRDSCLIKRSFLETSPVRPKI
jgi:hypothetical protein